jgi:hypothetical protein
MATISICKRILTILTALNPFSRLQHLSRDQHPGDLARKDQNEVTKEKGTHQTKNASTKGKPRGRPKRYILVPNARVRS